jgi:hypothetical protein
LSVQRQVVEHLFEIDFGTKNVCSIPLPVVRSRTEADPEISTEKIGSWRKSSPAQSHQ